MQNIAKLDYCWKHPVVNQQTNAKFLPLTLMFSESHEGANITAPLFRETLFDKAHLLLVFYA